MTSEINEKSYELFSRYCPKFKGFGGRMERDDARIKQFFDNEYEYMEFDYPLFMIKKSVLVMPNKTVVYVGKVVKTKL